MQYGHTNPTFLLANRLNYMNTIDQAFQTQLKNIQIRSGKSLDDLYALVRKSGLGKHGEIRDYLKKELSMGHGDANTLTTFYLKAANTNTPDTSEDPLQAIYSGSKAALLPIHLKLIAALTPFGTFEIAPKKAYVSLRCKKQFATVGPGSASRIDIGINNKDLPASPRLIKMPEASMCPYRVSISKEAEIDTELLGWIKASYDNAL